MQLFDYQNEAIDKCRVFMRGDAKWIIIDAPAGAGKTEVAMAIVKAVAAKGKMCEFICDRQNLVNQTSERFFAAGIDHGVLMGKDSVRLYMPIRISSAQTIESRGLLRPIVKPGEMEVEYGYADLYIIDECHDIRLAKLIPELKKSGSFVIGLTATSFKKELATYYEKRVTVRTTRQLIGQERLSRLEVVAPVAEIDTKGIPISAGEFQKKELTKRVLQIVGDVVPEWEKQVNERYAGEPQQTIGFFASIDETETFLEKFREAGHDFRMVHSKMDQDETRKLIDGFKKGQFMGLLNCAMLTRGSDFPSARILVNAYPTRSMVTIVQKFGRIMRTFPGKEYGLLIDHAKDFLSFSDALNQFYTFGPPEFGEDVMEKVKREERPRNPRTVCKVCGTAFEPRQPRCQRCGAKRPIRIASEMTPPKYVNGRLEQVDTITGETIPYSCDIWTECCNSALKQCHGDEERAKRRAFAGYKAITGKGLRRDFMVTGENPDPVIHKMMVNSFKSWMIRQRNRRGTEAA